MRQWFRQGVYGGLSIALLVGLLLIWLWRPEHQVRLHSENLLQAIAGKDWTKFGTFIGDDYQDQWGNDRALVLERTRNVFRYLRGVRITAAAPNVRIEKPAAFWRARVVIDGDDNEVMGMIKERINTLDAPFELEWRQMSAKPWDWKLVRVRNERLVIPSEFQ
jgi:hypothetical protein